jgi:hypothetical protein
MIDPDSQRLLQQAIRAQVAGDRALLDRLREEIRPLRGEVRRIQPRTGTSISLVATDGGNNRLRFDPFLVQVIRVVDSSSNQLCLEAVTPTTSVRALAGRQFDRQGRPATPLGRLMEFLGVRHLADLSQMIREGDEARPSSPSWIQAYRELVEWAVLFHILRSKDFATDTLLVFDGFLRSKAFAGDLFRRLLQGIEEAIDAQERRSRRHIYLAGVSKHSQVLDRYRLAMALEGVMATDYPAYLEIPRELEEKAYNWAEYARGDDWRVGGSETNKYVGGKMFFVKFGNGRRDPIWPVDLFLPQRIQAPTVLGHLLADAINGFPVPFYPLCLQKAHQHAALVDFDFAVLQDQIFDGIREILGDQAPVLDVFRLQDADPSRRRYE